MVDCAGTCNGDAVLDCAGTCNGDAVEDVCGECNGTETDPNNCFDQNTLYLQMNANGNLDVYMYNEDPVAGFQFNLTGINVLGASGGSAESNGFNVSTSASTVLGFSLTGATVAPGNGLLTSVSFEPSFGSFESCIDGAVISDSSGQPLAFDLGDCEPVVSSSSVQIAVSYTHLTLPTNSGV